MTKVLNVCLILIVVTTNALYAQPREIAAIRAESTVVIDAVFNDHVWQHASVADGFVTYQPGFGQQPGHATRVQVAYNNYALFVAAFMADSNADSIHRELTVRDNINGNTDLFGIMLNPNNDGQNAYEFWVTAANVQTDIRISTFSTDYAWDAVWRSAVRIDSLGWYVEMEIPYSAFRFPKSQQQTWAINFYRSVRRIRETSSFQPVDRKRGSKSEQMAMLVGISNVQSPMRISFMPYVSGYVNHYSEINKPAYAFNGGLDLKMGLSESHTLDMTLIPDFGQEKTDDIVLNLSPYETYYDEQRQFFTEGTELFDKCGLFYSRRIGKQPRAYLSTDTLADYDYLIEKNPMRSRLINAFKISGRNKNNLAIGVFNALTGNTYAHIVNPYGEPGRLLTEPWANYNMLVVDKAFTRYSYVNFTNAFVLVPNDSFVSNVSGTDFKFMDKQNVYGVSGRAVYSHISPLTENAIAGGSKAMLSFGKLTGNLQYSYSTNFESANYNPNVMGYLDQNNKFTQTLRFAYNIYEPRGRFNLIYSDVTLNYSRLHKPSVFTAAYLHFWNYAQTVKHLSIWHDLRIGLSPEYDYFEPRVPGRFYKRDPVFYDRIYLSSDYRKRLALDFIVQLTANTTDRRAIALHIEPRLRINRHLNVIYAFDIDVNNKTYGFVEKLSDNTIHFGKRNVNIITNTVALNCVFTNTMYLQLNARHYWSRVDYRSFYILNNDGTLALLETPLSNKNINFNAFNIDVLFSWNFAPGSFIHVVYKNNINNMEMLSMLQGFPDFADNFSTLLHEPRWNSISLKLIYYIDRNTFRRQGVK